VFLDGRLVSMAFQTEQTERGLISGTHALRAEWVAVDHLPFRNRVTTSVQFQVAS
jgi:hypothetical protein